MKSILVALALIVSSTAAFADSVLPPSLALIRCSNQQGVNVSIDRFQGIGIAAQVVQRPTGTGGFVAPQFIIRLKRLTPVHRVFSGMEERWVGEGFDLDITLESVAPTTKHPSSLKILTDNGVLFTTGLFCTRVK